MMITRPEESYRLWCVVVCDLGNLKNEEAMTRVGSQRHSKKKKKKSYTVFGIYVTIYAASYSSGRISVFVNVCGTESKSSNDSFLMHKVSE